MSKVDKQALRELAEKAGSGHWYEVGELRYHDDRSGETHGLHHDEDGFIAAANPATVLALLDEIKTLEGLYHMHRETEERQMIELRAEVAVLRRDAERYRWMRDSGVIEGDAFSSINEWLWAGGDFQEVSADIDAAMLQGGADHG